MTDKEEKNPLVRMSKCDSCEQTVAIRLDKNKKAYYNCTNIMPADGTACRRQVRFSIQETRRLLEDVKREQTAKPTPKDAGSEEVRDDATPVPPAKPQATKTEEPHPYD